MMTLQAQQMLPSKIGEPLYHQNRLGHQPKSKHIYSCRTRAPYAVSHMHLRQEFYKIYDVWQLGIS